MLHQTSNTPYTEQGAKAIDSDGSNISDKVKISGSVNRTVPGTYRLTYSVTGKEGLTATAARDVRILAPHERVERAPYGFSAQGKAVTTIKHTGIRAKAFGWMDLKVSSIDKNMTISIQFINTATKAVVHKDTFTAAGSKQYRIDEGNYELHVTIDKANGNSSYKIDLLMPEVRLFTFLEDEVPLADWLEMMAALEAAFAASQDALQTREGALAGFISYMVAPGDNLSLIAQKFYKDATRWHEIYVLNKNVIGNDPNRIYPGQELAIKID